MAAFSLASGACSTSNAITSVSAPTFENSISGGQEQLLDVRTPEEYNEGHIAGALNIDVKAPGFEEKAVKELDKKRPIYVYCRSGRRSLDAADILAKAGYKVVNLSGGILEWIDDRLPVVSGTE